MRPGNNFCSGTTGVIVDTPIELIDISAAEVTVDTQTYSGQALEPTPRVTLGDAVLVADTDFTVAYASNVNAGTAKMTLTGKGLYTGTKVAEFTIEPASIADAVIDEIPTQVYTGEALTPAVKVTLRGAMLYPSIYTVAYANNIDAGTATVTVTGTHNYTGTVEGSFVIDKAANTVTPVKTAVNKSFKVKQLKKSAKKVALPKVTTTDGTATWTVAKKDKKGALSLKNGNKIQVKKGTAKGTYTIKLKAKVAESANYKAATSKVVTAKVTVK